MIFHHFLLNVNEANAFVVACAQSREALLVDVGDLDAHIVDFIREQQLRLTTIFITHDHYDHIRGVRDAVEQFDVEVLSQKGGFGGRKAFV